MDNKFRASASNVCSGPVQPDDSNSLFREKEGDKRNRRKKRSQSGWPFLERSALPVVVSIPSPLPSLVTAPAQSARWSGRNLPAFRPGGRDHGVPRFCQVSIIDLDSESSALAHVGCADRCPSCRTSTTVTRYCSLGVLNSGVDVTGVFWFSGVQNRRSSGHANAICKSDSETYFISKKRIDCWE